MQTCDQEFGYGTGEGETERESVCCTECTVSLWFLSVWWAHTQEALHHINGHTLLISNLILVYHQVLFFLSEITLNTHTPTH